GEEGGRGGPGRKNSPPEEAEGEMKLAIIPAQVFTVSAEQAGSTVAAVLRSHLANRSWNQIRRFIEARRVQVREELCLDAARRVEEGDSITLLSHSAPKPRPQAAIVLRY